MLARSTAIILSFVMAFTIFPMSASATSGEGGEKAFADPAFAPGQLIVVTEQGTSKKQMNSIARRAAGRVDDMSTMSDGTKVALVDVEEGDELAAAEAFESEDRVLLAQPNYIYELEEDFPNDPHYTSGEQNYLAEPLEDGSNAGTINAKGAWDQMAELGTTSKPLVAVIDTGVRYTHEDLMDQVLADKCVTFNYGEKLSFTAADNSTDDEGHGTRVSGTIAAAMNNGKGVASMAGNWVDLFAVDVSTPVNGSNHIYTIDIAKGIEYAAGEGARLINISIGFYGNDYLCERAMKYAWDEGALCVCSAGNGGTPYMHYPGDSPYALTVMSHDWSGAPAENTNYGIDKDISAPGVNLILPNNTNNTAYLGNRSGTSYASPMAVGAAALLLAADPNLTNREIKNLLYTSTGQESFSAEKEGQGFGRIDISVALQNLLAEKTNPEKIVVNKPSITMYEGMETSFDYAVYPGNADLSDLRIRTSNKNVAVVYDDGVISARRPGVSTIEIDCGGIYTTFNVTVEKAPYKVIDKKPYVVTDTLKREEMMDFFDEVNSSGVLTYGRGGYYHLYRVELEENETIRAVMTIGTGVAVLRVRSEDGKSLAFDREYYPAKPYAMVEFTAEKAGNYQIQTLWGNPDGIHLEAKYTLKLLSDKSFCEPTVDSIDNGEMHMSWPAVEDAKSYRVRKYTDSSMAEIEFEETVTEPEFTDTAFDKDKANYYTVTSALNTKAGDFFNGETPFAVKLENPMTAEAKTVSVKASKLKKGSVKVEREKYLTVENAQGDLTYKKGRGNKKITVSKTGKLTIKKGLKNGNYNVTVSVTASGNDEYDSITQAVRFKVRVK